MQAPEPTSFEAPRLSVVLLGDLEHHALARDQTSA
jgi:hypothetical protein